MTSTTTDRFQTAATDRVYVNNSDFLEDLNRFATALMAQSRLGFSDPNDASFAPRPNPAFAWRTIAARMAATVKAEIFIPFAHVALVFQLDARDLQLLALALLSETDRSIADAFASLAHDLREADDQETHPSPTPTRPTSIPLTVATHLLGDIRSSLFSDGPLFRCNLIELVDANISTLGGGYRLAQSLGAYLVGLAAPQPRIGDHITVDVAPSEGLDDLIVDASTKQQLRRFANACCTPGANFGTIVLELIADDAGLAGALAAAAFSSVGYGIARLDAKHIRWAYQSADQRLSTLLQQLRLTCRDAALCTQVLMLTNCDALLGNDEREEIDLFDSVFQLLLDAAAYVVVVNSPARRLSEAVSFMRSQGARLFQVRVPTLTPDLRKQAWEKHASHDGLQLDDALLTKLAGAHTFTETRIAAVVDAVAGQQVLRGDDNVEPLLWDACRREAEEEPIGVAKRVDTPYRLHDLVAPKPTLELLNEALGQMRYRSKVIDEWGFAAKYPGVTNLCVLFHGPSGTGKTMASSILANELSLPLYRVDISTVLSKYIGETEQNIARLFDRAESMNVVLLFDEAEGLFSKRTETKDSHDRHGNLQIGFMLQRIESYPGLVILSTNLLGNMDKAFHRRFRYMIEFPFPTSEERLQLWQKIFPPQVQLDADVDLELLSEKAALAGGAIRNAAISAAFLAARDGTHVKMAHLVKAVRREYDKVGKLFSEADY
jgi:hypothetical protein